MKKWLLVPLLALFVSTTASCIIVSDDDATLTIVNDSSFVFYEIRVAEVNQPTFGRNLLGNDPLFWGEEINIVLACGVYDVLIVDETGATCTLYDVDMCFQDQIWYVDDFTLATCPF